MLQAFGHGGELRAVACTSHACSAGVLDLRHLDTSLLMYTWRCWVSQICSCTVSRAGTYDWAGKLEMSPDPFQEWSDAASLLVHNTTNNSTTGRKRSRALLQTSTGQAPVQGRVSVREAKEATTGVGSSSALLDETGMYRSCAIYSSRLYSMLFSCHDQQLACLTIHARQKGAAE